MGEAVPKYEKYGKFGRGRYSISTKCGYTSYRNDLVGLCFIALSLTDEMTSQRSVLS